jgi:hypothetical protein
MVATTGAGIGKRAVEGGVICRFFIGLQSGRLNRFEPGEQHQVVRHHGGWCGSTRAKSRASRPRHAISRERRTVRWREMDFNHRFPVAKEMNPVRESEPSRRRQKFVSKRQLILRGPNPFPFTGESYELAGGDRYRFTARRRCGQRDFCEATRTALQFARLRFIERNVAI